MKLNFTIQLIIAAIVSAVVSAATTYGITQSGIGGAAKAGSEASSNWVKQALLNEPQMMDDVFYALQAKRAEEQALAAVEAVKKTSPILYEDQRDPVLGPKDAKFTMVEFFDYNCSYCKTSAMWVKELLENNPDDVRVIFKDFPVLEGRAPGSLEASNASQAVWKQGQEVFTKFHFAMMAANGGYDSQRIDEIAQSSGVDVAMMRKDMKTYSEAFADHLQLTSQAAAELNIDGTPAFIADGVLVHGANIEHLQELFAQSGQTAS